MLTFLAITFTSLAYIVNAQLTAPNLVAASISGSLSGLKYTNVGADGFYMQVVDMQPGTFPSCNVADPCKQVRKDVSGPLAPFDEDLTFNFRGPLNLYNIAVYSPSNSSGSTWKNVSSWTANQKPENLVFMNNMGGGKSGVWTICGGNSQSYANGDFTATVATPNEELHSGYLPPAKEINIMTAAACDKDANNCEGFFRGTANEGWSGSKMLVVDYNMPSDTSALPAIWSLSGQIVRSAQYGCNCRGQGTGNVCAEGDIAETLTPNSAQAISEIYSYKGATGSGNSFFERPTSGKATLVAIYDTKTDSITIQRLSQFDYTQAQLSRSVVDAYINAPAKTVPFGTTKRASVDTLFKHRRHSRHH